MDLLNNESFTNHEILSNCKLSQLKRIQLMTDDPLILRIVINIILETYTKDTNELKTYYQNILNNSIGKYETQIHKLKAEIDKLKKQSIIESY